MELCGEPGNPWGLNQKAEVKRSKKPKRSLGSLSQLNHSVETRQDEEQEVKKSSSETMGQNTRNRVKSENRNWSWLTG